jgi:hypothetical protein
MKTSHGITPDLLRVFDNRRRAGEILDQGITVHPDSARLILLRADLSLMDGATLEALDGFRRAREKGADQAEVEAGYAFSLQLSGAPSGDCIAACRLATALNPTNGALRLNLAQLVFIREDDVEANRQLQEAIRLHLDESAQLEAQFYLLAHTETDPAEVFRTTKNLLNRGARLRWDVQQNIQTVHEGEPEKAELLELVRQIMTGELNQMLLDKLFARWPVKPTRVKK